MPTGRNITLDVAKGLCILLMVIGHSGCPEYLNSFIYMFHMPCFFFISGWLFKERYLDDVKAGLWKRVKGIYWPFLKWELIFLALHNLFSYCHLYRDSYSLTESLGKAGRILVMSRGEQLLGGYWFLIALFWTSILSLMLFYLQRRCNQLNINIISGG